MTETVTIASKLLSVEISPFGAEMQRITDENGLDLQWDGDPAIWHGRAPILFPVIGLLEGGCYRLDGVSYAMPKHGFARHSEFGIVAQDAQTLTFRLDATAETLAIYPFKFQLDVTFTVDEGSLTLAAVIRNLGDTAMPASFGFHPAFRWPLPYGQPRSAHWIRFAKAEPAPVRRIDTNGFLLAQPQLTPVVGDTLTLRDDLFVADALIFDRLTSRSVTYGGAAGPHLEVGFADFPTLGVWTKPGADFICIEAWHGFSDPVGFDGDIRDKLGIFEVAPHSDRAMAMTITLVP